MPRPRKEKKLKDIKLRQPDRSGPTEKTLLEMADEQNLFNKAAEQQRRNKGSDAEDALSSSADRVMDTLLYAVCLAMLHFTLDFLVQHQFAMEIEYRKIVERAVQALMGVCPSEFHMLSEADTPSFARTHNTGALLTMFYLSQLVFAALVHALHPHPANATLSPVVPQKYQNGLRQAIFFATSVSVGSYLIYITNKYSYLAVLKRSPPLGCLWVWSVLEMDLGLSVLSLVICYGFFWKQGYAL